MATANRKSVKRRRRSYFLSDFGPLDIAVADYSPSGIPIFLNSTGTDISLVSSANPVPVGQSVTFTATVTASTGQQVPTGTVKFADDQVVLAVVTLNSGEAILTTSFSATGTHNIHSWAHSVARELRSTSPSSSCRSNAGKLLPPQRRSGRLRALAKLRPGLHRRRS